MVLCAGLGTRLRPLTERWPKPALPLLGQPLLRYALAVLKRGGIAEVGINTHHLPDVMEATARAEAARAVLPLCISHEPVIQGTAGGVRGLKSFLSEGTFVLWNGDILFAVDLAAAVAEHRASGAAATMVLMPMPPGEMYASVEVARARVVRIAGRGPGEPGATPWHFTGVHVLSPQVFDFMSADGPEDINRDVYPRMLQAGLSIRAAVQRAAWSDLGTPGRYLRAQRALLHGEFPLEAFPAASPFDGKTRRGEIWLGRGGRVDAADARGPAMVDEDAMIEAGARIEGDVYVGAGSRIGAGAAVSGSAVLAQTAVAEGESLVGAIAWGDRRLRISGEQPESSDSASTLSSRGSAPGHR
jgi:mannose-1-phosphate guanylyltransferase